MKKMIMILGSIFIVSLAGIAALTIRGNTLDRESKAFVDATVPAIISDWDVDKLQKHASPEFNETMDYQNVEQFFEVLHELGNLEAYNGSAGKSKTILSLQDGIVITAAYDASADFESGSAEIQVVLRKQGDQWWIIGFTVTPEEYGERKDII